MICDPRQLTFDILLRDGIHLLPHLKARQVVVHHQDRVRVIQPQADLIAESLRILPADTVVHRLTGDAPGKLLIAPEWTRNKKRVLNTINRKIKNP